MLSEDIKIFLTIVENKSITMTADQLYLSQSTISSRLNALEDYVGDKLILRYRGKREIELTQKGKEFMFYAQNIIRSLEDLDNWRNTKTRSDISVSAPISVNSYVLMNFYNNFIEDYKTIMLYLSSHWNNTIYSLLEMRKLDIGISSKYFPSKSLKSTKLYEEKMVFVAHSSSKYADVKSIRNLKVEDEIFIDWGVEFLEWHRSTWLEQTQPKIKTDSPMMLNSFLKLYDTWAITPITVAKIMQQEESITIQENFIDNLTRHVYIIEQLNYSLEKEENIKKFKSSLMEFLSTIEYINVKYN